MAQTIDGLKGTYRKKTRQIVRKQREIQAVLRLFIVTNLLERDNFQSD